MNFIQKEIVTVLGAGLDTDIPLSSILLPIYFCWGLGDFSQFVPEEEHADVLYSSFIKAAGPALSAEVKLAPAAQPVPVSSPFPLSYPRGCVLSLLLNHKLPVFSASA